MGQGVGTQVWNRDPQPGFQGGGFPQRMPMHGDLQAPQPMQQGGGGFPVMGGFAPQALAQALQGMNQQQNPADKNSSIPQTFQAPYRNIQPMPNVPTQKV